MELGQVALIVIFCMVLILFVVGSVGRLIRMNRNKALSVGALRLDTSDPDGPYMFLELKVPVSEIMCKKQVTLDVNLENYISQK